MAECPRCDRSLTIRKATPPGADDSVDVDCCDNCSGIWIDGAELSRASAHLGSLFGKRDHLAVVSAPSGVPCPRCMADLAEVGVNGIAVDWCRACFGVWLDGGEYHKVNMAQRKIPATHAPCYVCKKNTPLGDTYYTDQGLVCVDCHEVEKAEMDKRAVQLQAAQKAYEQAQAGAERDAARARVKQLRRDLRSATGYELDVLRSALDRSV